MASSSFLAALSTDLTVFPDPEALRGPIAVRVAGWPLGARLGTVSGLIATEAGLILDGPDAHLELVFQTPRPPGWYVLSADIEADQAIKPRAYLEGAGGYSETLSFPMRPEPDGTLAAFFRAPAAFSRLRLTPTDRAAEVTLREMRLRRVETRELAVAALDAARSVYRRNGVRGLLHFLRSALITVLFPRRFDSFDRAPPKPAEPARVAADRYARWAGLDERRAARRLALALAAGLKPRITVVSLPPGPGETPADAADLIGRLAGQPFPNWRLLVADPPPDADRRVQRLEAATTIEALSAGAATEAEIVLALAPDARLAPHALAVLAVGFAGPTPPALVYADDDDVDEVGRRLNGRFRPGWSEAHFEARDYLGPLVAFRRSALTAERLDRAAGAPAPFTHLVLDMADAGLAFRRLAEMPVHRPLPADGAVHPDREPVAARLATLEARAAARGASTVYEPAADGRSIRARHPVPQPAPLVSILIPTRDRLDLVKVAVDSLVARTRYPAYEIIIIDNGSIEPETLAWFAGLTDPRIRVLRDPRPFNYSALNNVAVRRAKGEILVLLNNDTEVIQPDWLDEMVGWAALPQVGAVGAKLHFPNRTIQHGGVVLLSRHGIAGHLHLGDPSDAPGDMDRLLLPQDLMAVTGACLALRRSVYDEVGGLDEANLAVAFNDVDLCLKIGRAGYRIIWTPHAELIHHESVSRGDDMSPAKRARFLREVDHMAKSWGAVLDDDPFYSPHFERHNGNFRLAVD
jgi:GT2 family glycosyltransferase